MAENETDGQVQAQDNADNDTPQDVQDAQESVERQEAGVTVASDVETDHFTVDDTVFQGTAGQREAQRVSVQAHVNHIADNAVQRVAAANANPLVKNYDTLVGENQVQEKTDVANEKGYFGVNPHKERA